MKLMKLFLTLVMSIVIGATMSVAIGINPLVGGAILTGSSMIPKIPVGALGMGLEVELWHSDIQEELFKDNEFLKYAFDADGYVLGGAVVHIPQSGGPASAQKNRSVFPAVNVNRADTEATYPLDEYTTDPVLIQNAEEVEVSYDKRQSVVSENMEGLKEFVADDMLIKWASNAGAADKLKTTGDAIAATAPSATGNRKAFTEADLKAARNRLNKQNVAKKDRYALLPTEFLQQLENDLQDKFYYKDVANLPEGVITKLAGFYIMERSEVLIADDSDAIKTIGAAAATTDDQVAIFWQKNKVERAFGIIKMFENQDDPNNYGDVYSFLVRAGGRARRSDGKGVVLMIQDASA
jgi:hypothetical protein